MRSFPKKRKLTNIAHSRFFLGLLGTILVLFIWVMVGFLNKTIITRENRKIAENKLLELQKEKVALSSDIAKLQTKEGIEESIREKFGWAKEGEGMIVVMEDKNQPVKDEKQQGGFFSFIKNLFK